ncbi:MAG: MFS transporter [Oscillospiraceae bacterium]|jgi:MFS family permease
MSALRKNIISRKADLLYTIIVCSAGMTVFSIIVNAYSTLLPEIIKTYGINMTKASFISVSDNIGQSIMMLIVTFFGDRMDKRKVIGVGCFLYGVVYAVIGFVPPFAMLLVLRFMGGLCGILLDSLTTSYLSDVFGEKRSSAMVVTHMVYSLGSILAPILAVALLGADIPWNGVYGLFGMIVTVVGLLFLLLIFVLSPQGISVSQDQSVQENAPRRKIPYGEIFSNKRVIGGLIYSFLYSGIYYFLTLLPSYLTEEDSTKFPLTFCSLLITLYSIGSLVSGLFVNSVTRVIKKHNYMLYAGVISTALGLFMMYLDSRWAWGIGMVIFGMTVGSCYPLKFILATDEFPFYSAAVIGASTMASTVGLMLMSYISGRIWDGAGHEAAVIFTLSCAAVSSIILRLFYTGGKSRA